MVRKRHLALMLATALMLVTSAVHSQTDFPNRRIHMMLPYPAGGIVDIVTRIVTDKLSEIWR
jgi:tripartite-type tricarboxylate transporter receptor subunit TctC